jgi:hypothetical protein
MAFHAAFLATRIGSPAPLSIRFRYIYLSKAFCEQDQSAKLGFLSAPRKVKGLAKTKILEFTKENADAWQAFILKPVSMTLEGWYNSVAKKVFGQGLVIREVELGRVMARLAVEGEACEEEERIVLDGRILSWRGWCLAKRIATLSCLADLIASTDSVQPSLFSPPYRHW